MNDTQCNMILRWLQEVGAITPVDALREFGCMRLGARIWDLRHRGYEIVSETVESTNRFGAKVRYAKYRLAA